MQNHVSCFTSFFQHLIFFLCLLYCSAYFKPCCSRKALSIVHFVNLHLFARLARRKKGRLKLQRKSTILRPVFGGYLTGCYVIVCQFCRLMLKLNAYLLSYCAKCLFFLWPFTKFAKWLLWKLEALSLPRVLIHSNLYLSWKPD